MNLVTMAAAALRNAPPRTTATLTFTARDGSTVTGRAVGVPASGTPADGFEERQTIRERNRRLTVLLDDPDAEVTSAMTVVWEGATWSVSGWSPLAPDGARTGLGRVTLAR